MSCPPPDRPASVLVVDDDAGMRALLAAALGEEGFAVEGVASAAQAYERVRREAPELVVLDWWLGGEDMGAATCRRIAELAPGSRIVMYTGMSDDRDRHAALQAGAVAWLTKSMPLDQLAGRLRAILEHRQ